MSASESITQVPLAAIHPSLHNPRTQFDAAALDELSQSIRVHGILQPLLVRVVDDGYEIVAGERRYRAAQSLGLEVVPVTVRAMTDQEADEARLIENVQRADLSALEEARGYKRLMEEHGFTVDDLCARTGKKLSTIYARLALNKISKKLQTALETGQLEASLATEIAKVPGNAAQDEALAHILKPNRFIEGCLSFRQAKEYLASTFLIDLAKAPFDPQNGALTAAGNCELCPHRSGNCRDLYPEIKSRQICTNRVCYQDKLRAHADQVSAVTEKAGGRVLRGEAAEKAISETGEVRYRGGYVGAEDKCYDAKRLAAWKQILKDTEVKPVLAVHPESHVIVELFEEKQAISAAKAAGKIEAHSASAHQPTPEERKETILKNKIDRRECELVAEQALRGIGQLPESLFWAAMLGKLSGYKEQKAMQGHVAGVDNAGSATAEKVIHALAALDKGALRAAAFRAVASSHSNGWERWGLEPLSAALSLDWASAKKQAEKELQPKSAVESIKRTAKKTKKGGK